MNINLYEKTFHDSSESRFAILKVNVCITRHHNISIKIFYQVANKEAILHSLNEAGLRILSPGNSSLIIQGDGLSPYNTIVVALHTLKAANFIGESFLRRISEGCPHLYGGLSMFGDRTTLESLIRNYISRPIDNVSAPIVDHSALIEERHPGNMMFFRQEDRLTLSEMANLFNGSFNIEQSEIKDLPAGPNAQIIEDLGFPLEEIPKEYLCPISLAIMSCPVYLRNDTTGQRFERHLLIEWLNEHATHPISRQPFTITDLQEDTILKNSIDEFIQNISKTTSYNHK